MTPLSVRRNLKVNSDCNKGTRTVCHSDAAHLLMVMQKSYMQIWCHHTSDEAYRVQPTQWAAGRLPGCGIRVGYEREPV